MQTRFWSVPYIVKFLLVFLVDGHDTQNVLFICPENLPVVLKYELDFFKHMLDKW